MPIKPVHNMQYLILCLYINWLQLKNNAGLGIKRYDIDKDVIQLYFDEVRQLLCCLLTVFLNDVMYCVNVSLNRFTVSFKTVLFFMQCFFIQGGELFVKTSRTF